MLWFFLRLEVVFCDPTPTPINNNPWVFAVFVISSERDPDILLFWVNPKCFHLDRGEIILKLWLI